MLVAADPFWEKWYPVASEHFADLKTIRNRPNRSRIQKVAPSFIRVEADEVTYDLHVLLRFEIELGLIEGKNRCALIYRKSGMLNRRSLWY